MENFDYVGSVEKTGDQRLVHSGDHLVVLYNNEIEVSNTVTSYIAESLRRNERCIYIMGDVDTEVVLHTLKKEFNIDDLVEKGQFIMLTKEESYSKEGKFEQDKMVGLLQDLSVKAVEDGYDGLAITGELSWLLEKDHDAMQTIIDYECKLNEDVFDQYPINILCRYSMTKFSDEMIINIIQLHPYIALDDNVHENPFYIPPVGYKEDGLVKYQIKVWLENIVKFTKTKDRFSSELKTIEKENVKLLSQVTDNIILAMIGLLEIHDVYTKQHSESVAKLAKEVAGELNFSEEDIAKCYYTGLIHDIGKIAIPSKILNKQGKLTEEEFEVVKRHSTLGHEALMRSPKTYDIAKFVKHHHERYDGKGYPSGLIGKDIPEISRILCVVDAFDAMTHNRPYRARMTVLEAVNELKENSGTQFDPDVVDAFVRTISIENVFNNVN